MRGYLLDSLWYLILQLSWREVLSIMKKHPAYVATIHAIGGVGVGMLISSYMSGIDLVKTGIAFLVISLLGHVYAWMAK